MANSIKMEIELDGKDALKTLQAFQSGLKKTGTESQKAAKQSSTFVSVLKANLLSLVSINFAGFITSQVKESFQAFADFEQGLTNVAKTANLTELETAQLANTIEDLAKTLPVSTNELLDIATAAGQLGVKGTKNIAIFTETVAKLGKTTDVSGDAAATALARILNVTRENIGEVDTLASVIVSLGNNFAASESEIIAVTNEVARASAQFGVSSAEAAALSTALRSVGVRAEEAGGVVSKSFIAINKSIQDGGDSFRELQRLTGLSGDEIRKQFSENASLFFRNFVASLKNAEGGVQNAAATLERFGIQGIRVNKVIPTLANNIGEFDRALALANVEVQNATALNEEFEKAAKTTTSQTQLLANAVEQAQRNIGERLSQAFKEVTPLAADFISRIGEDQETSFIKSAKDAEVLRKELAILQRQLVAVEEDGVVGLFEKDPEKIRSEISLINQELSKIDTKKAADAIKDLESQIAAIQKSAGDPVLQSLLYGSPEEAARLEAQLKQQLANAVNLQALAGDQLIEKERENTENRKKNKVEEFDALNAITADQRELEAEQRAIDKELKTLEENEDFQRLAVLLGEENTLRELARIKNIKNEKKRNLELRKLNEKARKQEEAGILSLRKFENLSNKEKIAAQKSTLASIASLSQSSNSALFAIGKAASLSLAGINVAEGVTKALAAFPPPFNFAAAGAVGAAGAIQIARIAGSKPPSAGNFQNGGLITGPSQVGDRLTANVNAGETILNRRQTDRVFNAIDNNNIGGGGTTVNISNPMFLDEGGVDAVIDQINDAIEFRNKELRVG